MKPPIITLKQVREKTQWNDVVFESKPYEAAGVRHITHRFRLLPSHITWPTIDLYFDEHFRFLDALGFSHWHAHYDSWTDPRRNLVEAIRAVRDIVVRKVGLVEQLDEKQNYWGGEVLAPGEIPSAITKKIKRFRRVYFDRAPEFEEIDFSRYWEGKRLFVEKSYRTETEKLLREHNIPITW